MQMNRDWSLDSIFTSRPASRRTFLRISASALVAGTLRGSPALASNVPWLADVQRPPQVPNPPTLTPLLVDAVGQPIKTVEAWKAEREKLQGRWFEFLGPMSGKPPKVKLEILKQDEAAGCRRQLVRYESESGLPVEGYLLRPNAAVPGRDARGRRAGLVALHQWSDETIDGMAGVRGPETLHLGLKLAQQGFIVFCPRCFLWQNVDDYQQAVAKFRRRCPRTRPMRKMLWDASRGVDVLESLAGEVDAKRIGAVGHSLGAKETLYLTAFDQRIAAAVASEAGTGLSFSDWDAPFYLGEAVKAPGFPLDHHQLLGLIAPRPFLIVAGESGPPAPSVDDGDRSWPYIAAALPVYRLYGGTPRIGLYNHREGHTVSKATFVRLADWLRTYLDV